MFKQNLLLALFFLSVIFVPLFGNAEEAPVPINITSDRLVSDNRSSMISFVGNVKAVRDDLIIQSNRIDIHRDESESGLEMIIARGNVRINMKEKYATGEKAIYYEKLQKIILTGNPKSWEGKNQMTGDEMTFYIKEDKLVVKQSKKEQVNVIFYPKKDD